MLAMCKHPAMTMLSSQHILVSMLAHAAAGGAERKSFLKEVVTTPDASMVIGEPLVLQAFCPHFVILIQQFLPRSSARRRACFSWTMRSNLLTSQTR